MKTLFITQDDIETTVNIAAAFRTKGHPLTVIKYWKNSQQSAVIENGSITYDGKSINPSDYDAALLWCWGTAPLGRQFLALTEGADCIVLNSTKHVEVMDSKVKSAKLFTDNNISFPNTITFDSQQIDARDAFQKASRQIKTNPLVFKPDYGTQGTAIEFIPTHQRLQEVLDKTPKTRAGFILQEFLGNSNMPISHFRVNVSEGTYLPLTMRLTASEPLKPSNTHQGSKKEFITTPENIGKLAVQATKVSGLAYAGVDIMKRGEDLVVLEVNDGPGTSNFDNNGATASELAVIALENKYNRSL